MMHGKTQIEFQILAADYSAWYLPCFICRLQKT